MSGAKSDMSSDEKKPLTHLIVSKADGKIDDDPSSLDSVIRWETIEWKYILYPVMMSILSH